MTSDTHPCPRCGGYGCVVGPYGYICHNTGNHLADQLKNDPKDVSQSAKNSTGVDTSSIQRGRSPSPESPKRAENIGTGESGLGTLKPISRQPENGLPQTPTVQDQVEAILHDSHDPYSDPEAIAAITRLIEQAYERGLRDGKV